MERILKEFKTTKSLILHVLENYPNTRDNDNNLYVQCAKELGAKTLEDLENIELNMVSVHKLRQKIQNKEGLFLPSEKIQELRNIRKDEIREIMGKDMV